MIRLRLLAVKIIKYVFKFYFNKLLFLLHHNTFKLCSINSSFDYSKIVSFIRLHVIIMT